MKRMLAVLSAVVVMAAVLAVLAVPAFAAPNCTGNPADRPASCLTSTKGQEEPGGGPPRSGNFVGPG